MSKTRCLILSLQTSRVNRLLNRKILYYYKRYRAQKGHWRSKQASDPLREIRTSTNGMWKLNSWNFLRENMEKYFRLWRQGHANALIWVEKMVFGDDVKLWISLCISWWYMRTRGWANIQTNILIPELGFYLWITRSQWQRKDRISFPSPSVMFHSLTSTPKAPKVIFFNLIS